MTRVIAMLDRAAHMTTSGMSLRDWFAGQALVGILANTARMDNIENTAEGAFAFADAMLAARGEA